MVIIGLMLLITQVSLSTQSSVRAYVSGESEWSKEQKDAVIHINRYYQTQFEHEYQLFLAAIAVPEGDHAARIAMDQTPPDLSAASAGFLQGENHPDDIDGMIQLYLNFRHTPLLQEPIRLWRQADVMMLQIKALGQQLHQVSRTDAIQRAELINQINQLNADLTPLEQQFSNELGELSRQVNQWIYALMLLLTTGLVGLGVVFSRRMVAENLNAVETVKNSELRFKALLGSSMDAVIEIDAEGIVSHWGAQAESIFGYAEHEALHQKLHDLIIPSQYIAAHVAGMRRFLSSGEGPILGKRIEVTARRKSTEEFPAELVVSAYSLNHQPMFCAYIRDITEQKRHAEKLKSVAHFDAVTGLPNRVSFQEYLDEKIALCKQSDALLALMFIDIDNFKDINDTLGHQVGDLLLKEAAGRMLKCLRKLDFLARFGGDEFVLIVSDFESQEEIDEIAKRLTASIRQPFMMQNEAVYVSLSIGIASYPTSCGAYSELVKNADQAMYQVKKSGKNGFVHYNADMNASVSLKRLLINDLRVAVQQQQFEIEYQPIVDVRSGQILKCEALLRWRHPKKGIIEPTVFIPLAEEFDLILEIGDWVLREALAMVTRARQHIHPKFQISINVSPVQLQHANRQDLLKMLQLSEQMSEALILEITEGVLINASDLVADTLHSYRDRGIRVALDDFGTGYSSLSYLTKFDIDYIKIDKSFLVGIAEGSEHYALCEAMVVMAHKLGIMVVAEGVESAAQLDAMKQIGCDFAQGYYFAKPMSEDALVNYMVGKNEQVT